MSGNDTSDDTMTIWLGNWGAYVNGKLIDRPVALPMRNADLAKIMESMTRDYAKYGAGEEFYISEWEPKALGVHIGQYESAFTVNALAHGIAILDESEMECIELYLDENGQNSVTNALNAIAQVDEFGYCQYGDWGAFATKEEKYARELLDENMEFKRLCEDDPALDDAIDYERYGRYRAASDDVVLGENGYIYAAPAMAKYGENEACEKVLEMYYERHPEKREAAKERLGKIDRNDFKRVEHSARVNNKRTRSMGADSGRSNPTR